MRLATVIEDGRRRAVCDDGDDVWLAGFSVEELIASRGAAWSGCERTAVDRADLALDAVLRPPAVLCAGLNYDTHLAEQGTRRPDEPEFFVKAGQTIAGAAEPLILDPRVTRKLDYETELGVVIGAPGRHIRAADAMDHVFGYCVVNDVTARDRQVKPRPDGSTALALGPGKNFDGATRLSSWLVTADEIADPQSLQMMTWVDNELRQWASTAEMLFGVAEIIAYLSTLLTLQPGTIIATGTPAGTAWGTDRSLGGTGVVPTECVAGRYLDVGQQVTSSIEKVGQLSFTVAPPPNGCRR